MKEEYWFVSGYGVLIVEIDLLPQMKILLTNLLNLLITLAINTMTATEAGILLKKLLMH